MNKKFSFYIIIPILAGLIFTGTSCKKTLNEGPITSTYSQEFWTSQSSVEEAAIAMYGLLRSCLRSSNSYFINGDLTTGTFLPNANQWNYASITSSYSPPFDFSYVPYLQDLQDWSRFYQLIAQCNLILKNVPVMSSSLFSSESIRSSYLAEALFMRAYTYFYITRIWGDPVYVTKTYDNVDYGNIPPVARTAEATVLDSCIADLQKAASMISFANGDVTRSIRANKGSVYALLAHIYAWKHDYANAHLACQQVIINGGYMLEPMSSYTNIWKGQSSLESIFELPMTYNANDPDFASSGSGAEAQFGFFSTFLKGPVVSNQNSTCWIAPAGGLVDHTLFDTVNDARYHAILSLQPASGGDKAGYMLLKYANFYFQQPGTQTLPYINNDLVLFRLSDIYLLDAEALAYTNNLAGAAGDLSMTEGRAGISAYQSIGDQYSMIDETVMERGRELIGEGQWYYDLIRTEPTQQWLEYVGYPGDRVTAASKGYYWPLDLSTLFSQDKLLVQNPYWATHK